MVYGKGQEHSSHWVSKSIPNREKAYGSKKDNAEQKKMKMRDEYDFSKRIRGKHFEAYRAGHIVYTHKPDGTTTVQYFTEEDGAVMLHPDLKKHFPDSDAANRALRSLIGQS